MAGGPPSRGAAATTRRGHQPSWRCAWTCFSMFLRNLKERDASAPCTCVGTAQIESPEPTNSVERVLPPKQPKQTPEAALGVLMERSSSATSSNTLTPSSVHTYRFCCTSVASAPAGRGTVDANGAGVASSRPSTIGARSTPHPTER
eukprot:scaffold4659_cov125-Isochrysis_galbana.AAC.14